MKLSEAIRLGAMLKPQVYDDIFNERGTCAYGAAYDAAGILTEAYVLSLSDPKAAEAMVIAVFPLIAKMPEQCPACGLLRKSGSVVTHLNDKHRWTREAIADWVETIEQQQAQSAAKELVSCES